MGGGGDTTNVTNTGLGDDQFNTLTGNQAGISEQITTAGNAAKDQFSAFDTQLGNLGTSLGGLSANMLDRFTASDKAMSDSFGSVGTRLDTVDAANTQNFKTLQDLQGSTANLAGDVTQGFATTNQRFDTVDQATSGLQSSVDDGLAEQAKAFADTNQNIDTRFNDQNTGLTNAFTALDTGLTDAFGTTDANIANMQREVLTGQQGLGTNLDTVGSNLDTYYGDLSNRQTEIQAGQDEFKTSFDSYVDRYSDDTTLANQTRADLAAAQANATKSLRQDVGNFAQAAATGQAKLAESVDDVTNAVERNRAESNQGFIDQVGQMDQLSQKLVGGFQNLTQADIIQTRELANFAAAQTDLDMGMRENFQQLGSAFDDNGQLIRNSIDAQGNTISRAVDANGNLLLKSFDVTGREIGNKVININRSLSDLSNLRNVAGSNSRMGNLSPAMQGVVPTSGFMSPFAMTS